MRYFNSVKVLLGAMKFTVSGAGRLMLTRVAREKSLLSEPLVPNSKTIKAMKEARRGNLKSFDTVEALIEDLDSPLGSIPN
jgi:DNA-damage-inducible protein J